MFRKCICDEEGFKFGNYVFYEGIVVKKGFICRWVLEVFVEEEFNFLMFYEW